MPRKNTNTDDQKEPYQQILSRLNSIQHDVDSLKQTTAFALRAEAPKHLESVKEIFRKSERRVQVYLAVDGFRSVKGIAEHLSMQPQNVSTEIKALRIEELIEMTESGAGGDIYVKTAVDKTLRITRFLTSEYGFTADGLKIESKSKR